MAEEIDLEKFNFRKFRSPVTLTLTLDRVEVILVGMDEVYPHTKLGRNRKTFLWTYGRTDGRTHPTPDDLKLYKRLHVEQVWDSVSAN